MSNKQENWFKTDIKIIDFIGREPNLRIDNQSRNKTVLGGFLCFLIYCLFIMSALYFGQELVFRQKPNIIDTTIPLNGMESIKISNEEFAFFFSLYDNINGTYYSIDKFLSYKLTFIHYNDNGIENEIEIPLENCNSEKHFFNREDESYKNLDLSLFKCISDLSGNFAIYGNEKFKNSSMLRLNLNICSSGDCESIENISKILEKSELVLMYFDNIYDNRKFNKFYSDCIHTVDFTFKQYISKKVYFNLKITKFKTDVGYIFELWNTKSFHNVDYINKLEFNSESGYDIQFNFDLSYYTNIYYRKYYKIQSWMAEIGGIIRAMTLIAQVINFFYDRSTFYSLVINKLFDVDDIIKYFKFSDLFLENKEKTKNIRKRDSIFLRSAKKEKDYVEKGLFKAFEQRNNEKLTNNFLKKTKNSSSINNKDETNGLITSNFPLQSNNLIIFNKLSNKELPHQEQEHNETKGKIYNNNNNNNNLDVNRINSNNINNNNINSPNSFSSIDEDNPHDNFIESLKKNTALKEHFEKVKKGRYNLSCFESFKFFFLDKRDNIKFNIFIGGRELIRERTDILFILKKNLEFDRFKNLILRDNQLVLLNSLTKFMLAPERVNLVDFETCSYDKFIDCYDSVSCNSNMIDLKLTKWVNSKFKFDGA